MKCVVPLAGPDLWSKDYGFRPLVDIAGRSLLDAALRPRAWAGMLEPSDYLFVVRETPGLDALVAALRRDWPGCRIVTLSDLSGGALYSTLAAMALVPPDEAVIVDLADLLFATGPSDPQDLFTRGNHGAIVPRFPSNEACYSYLALAGDADDAVVTEAREKVVISGHASAGVYMFRTLEIFLAAAVHSIAHRDTLSVKGNLFICPMINGVIAAGHTVIAPPVFDCDPVSKMFHAR